MALTEWTGRLAAARLSQTESGGESCRKSLWNFLRSRIWTLTGGLALAGAAVLLAGAARAVGPDRLRAGRRPDHPLYRAAAGGLARPPSRRPGERSPCCRP